MDRREAMLRELNLYPVWVRREMPAQSDAVPGAANTGAVNVSAGAVDSHAAQRDEHAGEPNELPLFELPLQGAQTLENVAEDSLRKFQLQNQGGALGSVSWPELREKVRNCELCKLRSGCTQTVFGNGNEQAGWLFVGEAPGADEDATGEPFVGHAGHLLDNMLLAIKLKRSEIYIANVIKCRPPEDRHPHVGEIATCLPYLRRQIDLIKPKLIVALGKTAASVLLDTEATIASLRGTVHDYQGIPLIVTFHPAYLLRSPMEKAKAWQDLCLAVDTMQLVDSQG